MVESSDSNKNSDDSSDIINNENYNNNNFDSNNTNINNNINTTTITTTILANNNTIINTDINTDLNNNLNNSINNNNNNNYNSNNSIFNNSGTDYNYFIFPIDENGEIYKKEQSQQISIEMKPKHVILGTDRNYVLKDKITLYTDSDNIIQTAYPHQLSQFVGQYQFQQIIEKINNLSTQSNLIYKRLMIASLLLSILVFVFGIILHFYSKKDDAAIQVETIILFIIGIMLIVVFSAIPVIRNNKRARNIKDYLKELNQLFSDDNIKFKGEFDEVSKCSDRQSTKQLKLITIEYPLYSNNNNHYYHY